MGAAAVVILMRERRIVEAFERAGATSPALARSAADVGVDPNGNDWRRLTERAVVRPAGDGRFYLDRDVWLAVGRSRRRMVAIIIIVVVLGLLFGVWGSSFTHAS
jgi:hypothetical protein